MDEIIKSFDEMEHLRSNLEGLFVCALVFYIEQLSNLYYCAIKSNFTIKYYY